MRTKKAMVILQSMLGLTAVASVLMLGCDSAVDAEAGAAAPATQGGAEVGEESSATEDGSVDTAVAEGSQREAEVKQDAAVTSLKQLELADMRALIAESAANDEILVIDFWATWCVPCVAMFGPLHEAMEAEGSRVRLVSVTLDVPGDTEQKAIAFLQKHHALEDAYMMTPDTDARFAMVDGLGDSWSDLVVPVVLVFEQGELAGEFLGSDAQVDAIARKVKSLKK